jgi:hypothetical protein
MNSCVEKKISKHAVPDLAGPCYRKGILRYSRERAATDDESRNPYGLNQSDNLGPASKKQ